MDKNLCRHIAGCASERPQDTAITSITGTGYEKNFSYEELSSLINRCNRLFQSNGLVPSDDIMIVLPNSAELAVLYLSSIHYGLNFVPMSCEATKNEASRIFSISRPKMCFITDLVYSSIGKYIEEQGIRCILVSNDNEFAWLDKCSELMINDERVSKTYLMTSGSTGVPKAMVIDNHKLFMSGYEFLKFHKLEDARLRFWNYLPMSYLGGLFNLLLIPIISSGSSVITGTFSGKTFLSFWQTVERFEINALWFTPSIVKGLNMLATRIDEKTRFAYGSNVKVAFLGTAPISLPEKKEFEELFKITLLENFALSETTFFTSESLATLGKRRQSSVGEILPYVKLKLSPIEGGHNEILVKTPFLFDGYIAGIGKIELNTDKDGYFATSDLGYLDGQTLVINGRNRDIIKKGGYFISLREIELFAETNKDVIQACAVKIPHDFYCESYNLFVISKGDEDSIKRWFYENIVKYKWPENIIFRKEFPKTPSGKVKKHLLTA